MEDINLKDICHLFGNPNLTDNQRVDWSSNGECYLSPPVYEIKAKRAKNPTEPSRPGNEIWSADEIDGVEIFDQEDRQLLDYEVKFKQYLNSEDVYLGVSDVNPSSSNCQSLILKAAIPGGSLDEIQIQLHRKYLYIQTFDFFLKYFIPVESRKDLIKTKWMSDSCELVVEMGVLKPDYSLNKH